MDESSLKQLHSGTEEDVRNVLKQFNSKHAQSFSFPGLTKDAKQRIIQGLVEWLNKQCSPSLCSLCLETMRILSREKAGMDGMTTEDALGVLVGHAGLGPREDPDVTATVQDTSVMVEAQKCLCNIIFNSSPAQRVCSANGCVEGIVQRLKTYQDPELTQELKFFDMRILFLLTALCADIRPKLRQDLHGFTYLIEVLDLTLRHAEEKNKPLTDSNVDLCSEILKILFNLTATIDKNNLDEEEEAHFMRLVSVLHDLLVCDVASKDKREELHSHTVNLLTNMPGDSYEELLTPMTEGATGGGENRDVEYDGLNMEAVIALLDFLDRRLDKVGSKKPQKSLKESLTPALHCLCETCRSNRNIRKFCRIKVLPYLRDEVKRLPEEGQSIRNKLCRLLTNPVSEVKDLAADFLFVLCKESVARFVKYTGYGNAAGLLAQQGLMTGGRGAGDYSSESEDSETEEYATLREQLNAVTGRWEEAKADPMEGMSEEQKEYEAMQLVNALDKLQSQLKAKTNDHYHNKVKAIGENNYRGGIIQPVGIGPDGKPQTVEHILQLQQASGTPASASASASAPASSQPAPSTHDQK